MKIGQKQNIVKFLIIGDLHGQKPKIHTTDFDAIICPGDICGDDLRPYVKKWIQERTKTNNHNLDFDEFCPEYKQKILNFISLKKGRRILKYLNSFKKPVFLVPGNWDPTSYTDGIGSNIGKIKKDNSLNNKEWNKVKKGLKYIKDIEFKKTNFKGIILIGHGSTSAPELLNKPLKKDYKDDENPEEDYNKDVLRYNFFNKVYEKLNNYFKQIEISKKNISRKKDISKSKIKKINPSISTILLTHNVPYKTKLDKINAPGSYAHHKHYGSIIARELIEEYQPTLCIGGHIHEGYGKTRLRKTVCINAGFGSDVNTIVEIDVNKSKIVKIEFLGKNKEL